jgi:hypothetical protein
LISVDPLLKLQFSIICWVYNLFSCIERGQTNTIYYYIYIFTILPTNK